jgi:hypothetical protein
MLVNFTNHLGTEILNHASANIQFELSGAIDKTLTSLISFQYGGTFLISKETLGASLSVVYMGLINGNQTKEIKLNNFAQDPAFIFTNHSGTQITDHLSVPIYFRPPNGVKTTFNLSATVQLHRLINSIITDSFTITAEVAHHKVMNSVIDYAMSITGTQTKERNLTAQFLTINELGSAINNYRNLDSEINYNTDMEAIVMKRVGWWETIIVKFKE